MAKDYIEESGAKFPLSYDFNGINNFVFNTDVMFEDLQALCLGLVAKLEAAQQSVQLTGGSLRDLEADSTHQPDTGLKADTTPPASS